MPIKPELPGRYGHTHEQLSFIREMGIEYLNLNVMPDHANYEDMSREAERLGKYGIYISDFACPPLQKSPDIILGTAKREEKIAEFIDFIHLAQAIGAPLVSVAWQPNGILRTAKGVGTRTRGGTAFLADMDEINARPILNDRIYEKEEIRENFQYFARQVLPEAQRCGIRLALHPNDPPVASLGGVASLIASTQDYRDAFALAENSPALAMKMCVGCWLENPEFGDLLADIREFARSGQLAEVHWRNVSAPMPVFEEVLCEDGYGKMATILETLVQSGFDGFISVDHSFVGYPSTGGELGSLAYATGYMKGMLHTLEGQLR